MTASRQMQPQIVHETEVHRQHVRLKIPIQVEVDGVRYQVDDWSMGGFGIESDITSRQPGERFPAKLTFPFEDFEIVLRLDCQMVYVLSDTNRFGCRFVSLSRDQIGLFRYLVDAYLSGEVVSAGDILGLRGRDGGAQARLDQLTANPFEEEETTGRRLRRIAGYALVGLLGAGLLATIWFGVEQRFLTVEATAAVVDAPVFEVRAPASGILQPASIGEDVRDGQRLGTVRDRDGMASDVVSPCECRVMSWQVLPGQYAQEGEAVVTLVATDRPVLVRAEVPMDAVDRLSVGDRALVQLPGQGGSLSGQIERIDLRQGFRGDIAAPRTSVRVMVRTDSPLDIEQVGTVARVRFP